MALESTTCPDGIADMSGTQHAFYRVLGFHSRNGKRRYWLCRCKCGTVQIVREDSLHRRCRQCRRQSVTSHGMSGTPEFSAWSQMISRCTDSNRRDWPSYGGRGIKVCDRWRYSFENFYSDMGQRPSSKHSLDRFPDNDGDYTPSNCRWATRSEQARNRRNNRHYEYNGRTMTLADICDAYSTLPYSIVQKRIGYGWSLSDAVTKPYGYRPK